MSELLYLDEREEELSSIAAIYPELSISPRDACAAWLDIPVAPTTPLTVLFPPVINGHLQYPITPQPPRDIHELSYLPPLRLRIVLPAGYPSQSPPQFKLSSESVWVPLAKLRELEDKGAALWEEYSHGQVVFAYIDYLQQVAERAFGLVTQPRGIVELPTSLKVALLDFDIQAKRERFEQETFNCGVCLEPKKGSSCYQYLSCGHVFCVSCLQAFYNSCIKEGDVASVTCLDLECGKEQNSRRRKPKTLNQCELLQIPIAQDVVQRYVELKRKRKLGLDKTTVYCPRKWCQGPARPKKRPKSKMTSFIQGSANDSESDTDFEAEPKPQEPIEPRLIPVSERLAVCEDCKFAFCRVCLRGWHGEFVRCEPRDKVELDAEEQASWEYIRRHTSACPTCGAPCQKTMGCNHMNCYQCRTHFCYLCGSWLDPANPYRHFNEKKRSCYQRLLEPVGEDEG